MTYLVDMKFDSTTAQQIFQQTITAAVTLQDIGLHSGRPVVMRLLPAEANTGVTFIRTDRPAGENVIPARWDHVIDTRLCTVIGNEFGARVGTVEHVMSALTGLGIDNCIVEIDAEEVPAVDGSAAPFIAAIDKVGVIAQAAPRRALEILRPVSITPDASNPARTASLSPLTAQQGAPFYAVTVDYSATNARIGKQTASLSLTNAAYRAEISGARTFTLFEELDMMWKNGLGLGGSLDNAVIVWGDEVVNMGGLRYDTEFARHKLLDAIGDLALAGGVILGAYSAYMTGHALNNQLLRAVFADPANYRWVDLATVVEVPAQQSANQNQAYQPALSAAY